MAIENGYTTLDELKASLRVGDSAQDARLEACIEAASRWIDAECSRTFYVTGSADSPAVRYLTARSARSIRTPDLLQVVALKTDQDGDDVYETEWSTDDFLLAPRNAATDGHPYSEIKVAPGGGLAFPTGEYAVEIAGIWGYAASIPSLIRSACLREAARRFRLGDAPFGVTGAAEMGTVQVSAYDPEIRKDVEPFRRLEYF
jgi:hypothetical protein